MNLDGYSFTVIHGPGGRHVVAVAATVALKLLANSGAAHMLALLVLGGPGEWVLFFGEHRGLALMKKAEKGEAAA